MVVFNNGISKMNILIVFNISICDSLERKKWTIVGSANKSERADT